MSNQYNENSFNDIINELDKEAAPRQGGNPHGFIFGSLGGHPNLVTPSTGDPHSSIAPKGDPHLCIPTVGGGAGGGAGGGKTKVVQC